MNPEHPFVYKNGALTELSFGGTGGSAALDVSGDGNIIVGSYQPDALHEHALKYSNGVVTDLGTLPGQTNSIAWAVSADGNVIVGDSNHAFKYTGGVMTDLGTLGGTFSEARGVSADGSVIAGDSDLAGPGIYHAFKYTGTTMSDLGTLGGNNSRAFGISADGSTIVGGANIANNNEHAFKYTGTTMTDLGTLGGATSLAFGASSDGAIVLGEANIAGDGAHHAFEYQNGVMTDLGTLGGTNSSAYQISADNKVIIGISDTTGDVAQHAYLLRLGSANAVDINNTAAAIAGSSRQLNSIINLNESSLNFALSQDATLFGANNLSISVGSRYTQVNPYSTSQVAATLKLAYRFNEHLRAGIFLDQAANNSMPNNYALRNAQPIVGIFTTLTQRGDNTGAQLRLAAAYNSADLSIARATLANTEAGRGTSSLTSKGALLEASYGFKLTENLNLRPLAGLRVTKVSRDSYVEDSGADFPIAYKNMEKRSTTSLAGLQLSSAFTTNYLCKLG